MFLLFLFSELSLLPLEVVAVLLIPSKLLAEGKHHQLKLVSIKTALSLRVKLCPFMLELRNQRPYDVVLLLIALREVALQDDCDEEVDEDDRDDEHEAEEV